MVTVNKRDPPTIPLGTSAHHLPRAEDQRSGTRIPDTHDHCCKSLQGERGKGREMEGEGGRGRGRRRKIRDVVLCMCCLYLWVVFCISGMESYLFEV